MLALLLLAVVAFADLDVDYTPKKAAYHQGIDTITISASVPAALQTATLDVEFRLKSIGDPTIAILLHIDTVSNVTAVSYAWAIDSILPSRDDYIFYIELKEGGTDVAHGTSNLGVYILQLLLLRANMIKAYPGWTLQLNFTVPEPLRSLLPLTLSWDIAADDNKTAISWPVNDLPTELPAGTSFWNSSWIVPSGIPQNYTNYRLDVSAIPKTSTVAIAKGETLPFTWVTVDPTIMIVVAVVALFLIGVLFVVLTVYYCRRKEDAFGGSTIQKAETRPPTDPLLQPAPSTTNPAKPFQQQSV